MPLDESTRARMRGDVKRCANPGCDTEIRVRPADTADDHYQVSPPGEGPLLPDRYCSARCVARGMAGEPGVERVNVYDAAANREGE